MRFLLPFLACSLVLTACQTAPTAPTNPLPPEEKELSVAFVSDATGSGAPRLVLTPVNGTQPLVLEVHLEEVTDFYGLHFDLLYPYELLRYRGIEEGTFLLGVGFGPIGGEAGVIRGRFTAQNRQSRVNGSGIVFRILFEPIAPGEGRIDWRGYGTLTPGDFLHEDQKNFGDIDGFGGSVETRY